MHGCCLAGLGDDGVDLTVSSPDISTLTDPSNGILSPSAPPVTVSDLANYVNNGTAPSDPSVASQLATLISQAGPAVQSILQQVQYGQMAANTPLNQLAQLRSAYGLQTSGAQNLFASLTANPMVLLAGAGLLFFVLKRR